METELNCLLCFFLSGVLWFQGRILCGCSRRVSRYSAHLTFYAFEDIFFKDFLRF